MNKIRHILRAAALFAAPLLASCEHKELNFDNSLRKPVRVVFDWSKDTAAQPKSMRLYLFPTEGGPMLCYEFLNREGGTVDIPYGTYDAFCLNGTTEYVRYRHEQSPDAFEVYSRDYAAYQGFDFLSAPRAKGTEEERLVLSPDMLWCDRAAGIPIARNAVSADTLRFCPEVSVSRYTVEIQDVENLKYSDRLSGSLSGLSGSFFPGSGKLGTEAVTYPLNLYGEQDGTTLTGEFLCFGHEPGMTEKNLLVVYAELSDGQKFYSTPYDVTEQVRNAPDPRQVHLVVKGLPLPKPIHNGSGLQPSVNDWIQIDVHIQMK